MGHPTSELTDLGPSDETGTQIEFFPDPEIFESVTFDYDLLRSRFREMAFLNKGIRITPVSYTHLYFRRKHGGAFWHKVKGLSLTWGQARPLTEKWGKMRFAHEIFSSMGYGVKPHV